MKKLIITCLLISGCASGSPEKAPTAQFDFSNYNCEEIAEDIKITQSNMNTSDSNNLQNTALFALAMATKSVYYTDDDKPDYNSRLNALRIARAGKKCK